MKARIKGTDAVIRVQPIYSVDGLHIEQFVNTANGDLFPPRTIDIIPNDTDWDALRNQAAIAAMQGTITILSSSDRTAFREIVVAGFNGSKKTYPNEIVDFAVACADALIEELKKK